MEKRMKRKVAAGAAALLAVAGGGAAIGATQLSPKQENQTVLNDAAKELGVTPGALAEALKNALEKRIDAAVAAGRISQAQADEMKQRIDSGELPFPGPAPGMFFHHELFRGLDAAAAYLGLSEDELHAQLESGKSLADVAKGEGKSVDGLVDALAADAKKHLDGEVAEGNLTEAQAEQMFSHMKEGIRAIVTGERPNPMPGRPGFGFRHEFDGGPNGSLSFFDDAA
jgi:polyhydroxyalkanoate synthesis regulator phasin